MGLMDRAFGKILDFVFPRHCLVCGEINPAGKYAYLCENCANGPFSYQVTRCKKCAEIIGGPASGHGCAKCESENFYFDEALVACEYAAAGRELVIELKYRSGIWVAGDIVRLISETKGFAEYFENSILVPVPVSRRRKRTRGYNQSEIFARLLAKNFKRMGIGFSNAIKRKRHTDTQTALTREERARNVKGAFEIASNNISKDSRLIVVDDVMTSGATLNECAKVLKRAGFKNVRAFAFARRS